MTNRKIYPRGTKAELKYGRPGRVVYLSEPVYSDESDDDKIIGYRWFFNKENAIDLPNLDTYNWDYTYHFEILEEPENTERQQDTSDEASRHPHADLMIAYANNKKLKFQFLNHVDNTWCDLANPSFLPEREYRIKPEPKLVKKYQVLYKNVQGSAIATPFYYATKEEFESAHHSTVTFLQFIEQTAIEVME